MIRFFTLGVLLSISACSSQKAAPPVFSESFVAVVTERGLRQFTFDLQMNPNNAGGRGSRAGKRSSVQKLRQRLSEDAEQAVQDRLDFHLQASKFCRHGYFIISKQVNIFAAEILGECKAVSE